jgi:hypothetical protein
MLFSVHGICLRKHTVVTNWKRVCTEWTTVEVKMKNDRKGGKVKRRGRKNSEEN